jgi:hypothetical protein
LEVDLMASVNLTRGWLRQLRKNRTSIPPDSCLHYPEQPDSRLQYPEQPDSSPKFLDQPDSRLHSPELSDFSLHFQTNQIPEHAEPWQTLSHVQPR